jgi:AcrR family transcriptional regulator
MPRIPFRVRVRQEREAELIEEAARLLRQHDYAELNMDQLADIVGISKATLYQHFRSKDDLVAQVMIKGMHAFEAQIDAPDPGSPLDRLCQVMRFYLRERHLPGHVLAGFATDTILRVMHADPATQAAQQRIHQRLAELVDAGKAAGQIDPACPTSIIVRSVFCLAGTLSQYHNTADDSSSSAQTTPDSAIEHVIALFRKGIASATS